MGLTFAVDDVKPAPARLPEHRVPLAAFARADVLGASRDTLTLVEGGLPEPREHGSPPGDRMNALAQTVDLAFREHRPLRLTPDALWITLAQGFSIHVRENAEALRQRFVRHEGRAKVQVTVEAVPSGAEWRDLLARFAEASGAHLGPGVVSLLTRPFSTTGPDEQTVFRVALIETFSEYFEYEMLCICGIPEVTLEGTPDDYRDIKRRVEVMGEYDLRFWTDQLLPICDQWIATAEGHPDRTFWKAIHRPEEIYGGHLVTGWLARLFPYVRHENRWERNDLAPARRIPEDATKPEGFFESVMRLKLRVGAAIAGRGAIVPWAVAGVSPRNFPSSWSKIKISGRAICEGRRYEVAGGLAGVAQAPGGLALEPVAAWLAEEVLEAHETPRNRAER